MTEVQPVITGDPAADLNVRIGIIGQRQEALAQVVEKLDDSVADFGQLRTYVEQIAQILADVAKEVAGHDLTMVEHRLAKLAEAVGDVDKLRSEVSRLRNEVDQAAEPVEELAQRPDPRTAVWWPDLPAGPARAEAMQSLGRWVDEVLRARHPEAYNELGTCWFLHPDILDELTALQAAWLAAYRDTASPGTAAIEWHDRWLPGAMARCRAAIRARGCKGRHEKEPDATMGFLDRQEFKNFVRCAPEAVTLTTEPSPPWDRMPEPSPPADVLALLTRHAACTRLAAAAGCRSRWRLHVMNRFEIFMARRIRPGVPGWAGDAADMEPEIRQVAIPIPSTCALLAMRRPPLCRLVERGHELRPDRRARPRRRMAGRHGGCRHRLAPVRGAAPGGLHGPRRG